MRAHSFAGFHSFTRSKLSLVAYIRGTIQFDDRITVVVFRREVVQFDHEKSETNSRTYSSAQKLKDLQANTKPIVCVTLFAYNSSHEIFSGLLTIILFILFF